MPSKTKTVTKSAVKPAAKSVPAAKPVVKKQESAPAKVATTKPVAKQPVKAAATKPKVEKKEAVVEQEGGDLRTNTRYFKIVGEDGSTHGRFSGKKPKQAANKALTSILKEKKTANKDTKGLIKFSIVECTRGSKHKTYNYEGQRKKLPSKMTVTIDDKEIVYEFSNTVKKAPKAAAAVAEGGAEKKAVAPKAAKTASK